MNSTNEEYIQLPPLHRDTEGIAVRAIWEFTKLTEEERERVHAELKSVVNKENIEKFEEPSEYRKIKSEEVKAFEETISTQKIHLECPVLLEIHPEWIIMLTQFRQGECPT